MSNICIIPARGGSKRIPRKNIKLFLGKPIISYSIKAAFESNLFDEIMVSTDDKEIAHVAKSYGASVPFLRTDKNSDDHATTFDVLEEVLDRYKRLNKSFTNACCLYSCAPFVNKNILEKSYELLLKKKFDCVFPIVSFSYPVQRAFKIRSDKSVFFNNPKFSLKRSQDLEKMYHDSGQFYWFKCKEVLSKKELITINSGATIIDELECQDIDTISDWKLAELKYELLYSIK